MSSMWPNLISRAEKLIGGPAPFINLGSLLSSEAGFLAARARRLAATVDHPFFSIVHAYLRGRSVNSFFSIPSYISGRRSTPIVSNRPSGGLIILLIGQSYASASTTSTKLCSQHRSLAELFETIHFAVAIHKSLVDLNTNVNFVTNSNSNGDTDHWLKDMELVNKLATLTGDALLASVSSSLARFCHCEVVDIVSEAIGNMTEAEFSPIASTSNTPTDNSCEVFNRASNWLSYVQLSRGSLLGSCCQSAFLLTKSHLSNINPSDEHLQSLRSINISDLFRQFGLNWACLVRLVEEREQITRYWLKNHSNIHSCDIKLPFKLGYTESGLLEPTYATTLLSEKSVTSGSMSDIFNDVISEYNELGNKLAQTLRNSFTQLSRILSTESDRLPSIDVLSKMVDQLILESTSEC